MSMDVAHRRAARDAAVATLLLLVSAAVGSHGFRHFDPALSGYFVATLIACFASAYHVARFWRRPPSAFYGRALLAGLARPRSVAFAGRAAARDMGFQTVIAPRGRARWCAHLCLSWGTLAAFAVTIPLVCGWVHLEADAAGRYVPVLFGVPAGSFDPHGAVAWLVFNALNLSAVAVVAGTAYFLAARLRRRHEAGSVHGFHTAPLLLLLAVALSGLALTLAGRSGSATTLRAAALGHEALVVLLLVSAPYGKLAHLFVRPLQVGARLVRKTPFTACCSSCGTALAPAAQLESVERLLVARGFAYGGQQRLCPACRRRRIASTHSAILGGHFQPGRGKA